MHTYNDTHYMPNVTPNHQTNQTKPLHIITNWHKHDKPKKKKNHKLNESNSWIVAIIHTGGLLNVERSYLLINRGFQYYCSTKQNGKIPFGKIDLKGTGKNIIDTVCTIKRNYMARHSIQRSPLFFSSHKMIRSNRNKSSTQFFCFYPIQACK